MGTYHAFKKATDGSGDRWGYVTDLSLAEAQDEKRFPLGRQTDSKGRTYIWTYAMMPRYIPDEKASLASLGRPSVPLPSAAGLVLKHMSRKR